MPDCMPVTSMTSLTLEAIAGREEDAVVVDYILKGKQWTNKSIILKNMTYFQHIYLEP